MLACSTSVTVFIIGINYRGEYGCRVPRMVKKVILKWTARTIGMGDIADTVKLNENEVRCD